LFTLGDSGATVDASGTGALVFTNTGGLAYSGTAGRLLTLTGTNTNDNTLTPVLANNAGVSSFTKAGIGKWVMKAANTYTGVTTVSGGTLSVGDGTDALAALGSNTVSIATGTTLNFNHNADVTVANAISGAGQLNKLDTYTLTLTGVNSYTGATSTGSVGGLVFANNTAPATSGFTGSGTVTIEPSTTSFGSLVTGNYTYDSNLTGLTLGKAGNLTNVTLNSLVNIAGPITVYAPQITVNQALSSGAGLVLHGASVLNGGSINTTGAQTYDGAVTLGAATTLGSTGSGAITFGSTLNGGYTLAVNTAGATTFTGAVGGTAALTSLTTDAGGTVAINGGVVNTTGAQVYNDVATLGAATTLTSTGSGAITFGNTLNGAQTLAVNTSGATTFTGAVGNSAALTSLTTDAGGTVAINGGVVNTTGAQIYNDAATLGAATTLTSTSSGAITFGNTLNGAQTLAVNTSGTTTFTGAVGGTAALTSLTTDAAGTVAINGGVVNTTGAQIYNDAATLGAATVLTSTGSGAITFGSTLNGGYTLAVNTAGATTFTGAVGGTTALTSLTTDAGGTVAINGGVVDTTGAQTYNEVATLGAATVLSSTGSGAITFGNTLNGGYTLAVNTAGATTFTGAVGGNTALTSLTTDAGGTVAINGGVVNTTGAQSYGEAATLGANTTLTSTAAGNITFGGTLDGAYTLTVNTAGITTFNGEVGGTAALTSITTDAPGSVSMSGGRIKTTGAQTYNDAINLAAATTLQGVNLALMSTVDGTQALTLSDSGTTVLGGVMGGTSPLLSLTTDSLTTAAGETQLKGSSIHTTGSTVFNDIVKVFTDVSVQTGGDLKFMQTVNGDTANTRSLTLDAGALGNISVQGVVGGTAALKTLEVVNSNTATFTGVVTTGTSVVLTDTVDAHVIAFNGGLTTPTFTVAAEPFALTLGGTIAVSNGIHLANTGALQLNGTFTTNNQDITLGQAGQTTTLLANTHIDSGTATTTVNGSLSGGYTLGFASPVNFSGNSTVTASTVTFDKPVTAGGNLTVNGATVINGGSVNAGTHTQTYNGSVTVNGAATDTTTFTGVGMTFGSTLDGASRVMVADSGATTYVGAIGATAAPAHFETDAAGSSTFSGGTVRTSSPNSIYIADDAVVTAHTTFDTTNNGALAAGANITFAKTLNGTTNNAQAVTINAGTNGVVLFSGAVGNTVPLSTLTLTNSNGTTFAKPVTVGTSVVLSDTVAGQTIRFADNLSTPVLTTTTNGYNVELLGTSTRVTAANTATTFLNTGNLVLGNAAADVLTFAGGLTATAPAAISAAGTLNTTNTAMSLGDSNTVLTLADHLTLDTTGGSASAGGSLTLGGAVNGTTANAQSLTLNAGSTGTVSVVGIVGGTVNGQSASLQTLTLTHSNGATFSSPVTTDTSVVLDNTTAGQTIRFADDLTTPVLTTTANGYNVELLGTHTHVSAANTATTFLNTGNLVLGNAAGDTLTFAGGLTATAPAAVQAAGTLNTTNTAMSLGDSNTGLTLSDDLTLNTTGGNLTLGGAVNGTTANTQSLTLNAGSTGAVSVAGGVGQTVALKTLTLTNSNGAAFNGAVTTGTSVVLSDTVVDQTVSFADNLTTPVLTTTAHRYNVALLGDVTHISGTSAATEFLNTGSLVLGNAADDVLTFAGGLTATAPTAISAAGTIGTAGTTNAAIVLGTAPVALTGNTTFDAGSGNLTLGGKVDGAYSLALNSTGVTTLADTLGAGTPLSSLTTDAGGTVVIQGGRITTSGTQTYNDDVLLDNANGRLTTLNTTNADVMFGGKVNNNTATAEALTINAGTGAVTFTGAVGDAVVNAPIGALIINSGAATTFVSTVDAASVLTDAGGTVVIQGGRITTSGTQTYNDDVLLDRTGTRLTTLNTTNADVMFGGKVNNNTATAEALTINAGTGAVTFTGAVGDAVGHAPVGALSVNSGSATTFVNTVDAASVLTDAGGTVVIQGGRITTSGTQTYNEIVRLQSDTTFTGSTVTFNDAVEGAGDLSVVGEAVLNAGTINTTGAQSYSSTVTLVRDTVLTANSVGFAGAVNSSASGASALTVNSSGATSFDGAVGDTHALRSLSTNAGGTVAINGGAVTTTGTQTYGEAMTLGTDTTLTASGVTFGNTVTGTGSLSVNGPVTMNGGNVTTAGAQTYSNAITLGANTTLTSTGGTLNFVSITDGASSYNLDVNSATALVLNDVTLLGDLHTTTQAGGVSQATGKHLDIGGTSTFTATQTAHQNAAINSVANRLVGRVTFDETTPGSWVNVGVTTTTALTLAPLQSGGAVTLNTQGASLTTSSISASGNLNVNTAGGAASLGAATVSGAMTVLTANGAVTQTGQFVVTGNTSVTAGTGTITLLNPINSFGGTLALQGTSTSVATSGNLQLASVTNTGPMVLRAPSGSIDLGTAFITGGDLTLQSQGNMNLGGANITGSLDMTSTLGTVSFGQATVTGSLTATTNNKPVDLGAANVGGNLNVQTNGGNVVQSTTANAALHVTGASNINAGTGDVVLPNIPNQFGGAISVQANDVQLVASSNLIMGPSTITGDASVTSVTGNITQTAPMTVAGTGSFAATHGDVTLSQANTLTQAVTVQAVNANLNTNTALTLASSTVTGNLVATVASGDITQTGPLLVTGTSNLAAPAGNITLTDAANNFGGRVSVDTPQALQLTTSGALSMGVVNVGMTTNLQSHGILDMGTESVYTGKLKVSSGGFDIIQSGPLKAGADEDFDAGNAKIDLFNPKNLWLGALYFKGGIIMINHPQLLNAVNSGVLMVRAETNMPIAAVRAGGDVAAPAAQPATGSTGGNAVSVVVNRAPSTTQTGVIQVQVAADVAAPGKTFSFEMDPHAVAGHAADAPVKISQMDGKPLPNWLRYNAANKTFTASEVPAGAFPLQLKVAVGNTESVMVIQEKPPGK